MNKTVNFRELDLLPKYVKLSQEALSGAKQQLQYLTSCKDKPYVLDDQIINRITKACNEQLGSVAFYEEQFKYWYKQNPSNEQIANIAIAENTTEQLTTINKQIIQLIDLNLKNYTIDRVLQKDDVELAIDFLSGKFK